MRMEREERGIWGQGEVQSNVECIEGVTTLSGLLLSFAWRADKPVCRSVATTGTTYDGNDLWM
jgi:hypothetical protein